MKIERWDFSFPHADDRLKQLSAPPPFEAIVEEIKARMEILCCHSNPCSDNNCFKRVIYCIRVPKPLFDLFFNSRNGYRASYYRSPYEGLRTNDLLIQRLLPALIASGHSISSAEGRCFTQESLISPSAKVWLAEPQPGLCDSCTGEWDATGDDTPEIQNNRWEHGDSSNVRWGRKAPFLTKLRVFGAFLNTRYDEFVPERKRHRAKDIHECGWS